MAAFTHRAFSFGSIASFMAGLAIGCCAIAFGGPGAQERSSNNSLVLRDKSGTPRLTLLVDPAGDPQIIMTNRQGNKLFINLTEAGGGMVVESKAGAILYASVLGPSAEFGATYDVRTSRLGADERTAELILQGKSEYRRSVR